MSDVLVLENFLDAATCATMIDELRIAQTAAATVYGRGHERSLDVSARRTTAIVAPSASRALILDRLRVAMESIGTHFGVNVAEIEEPQFLRYQTGDYFVAHQDGNTGMILVDETNVRRISTVLFLSDPAAYEGGSLVFHHSFTNREPVAPPAGTLIAFLAEKTHEVTAVTGGERYTVVSWYR